MAQQVKLRRSSVAGNKPTTSQLELGELAINTNDGKLYFEKSSSLGESIQEIIVTNAQNTGSINLSGSLNIIGNTSLTGSIDVIDRVNLKGTIGSGFATGYLTNDGNIIRLVGGNELTIENAGIRTLFSRYDGYLALKSQTNTNIEFFPGNNVNPYFILYPNGTSSFAGNLIVTGSLIATSFTGSLFGTASYASNALSSSYALVSTSASYAATSTSASYAATASYYSGSLFAPGSTTQILYNNGGTIAGDSGLVYSGSNVGIGTTSPNYKLDVSGVIRSKSGTTGTLYLGETSGGTTYVAAALIGTPSTTYNPTGRLSIQLPTHGVGTDYGLTEQMSIQVPAADSKAATMVLLPFGGNVGIGTTSPLYTLDVNGTARVSGTLTADTTFISNAIAIFQFKSASSLRWELDKEGTETGGNAGSNLTLYRYDDSGGYLGTAFTLNRQSGLTTFSAGVTATSFTGSLQGTATTASYYGGSVTSASYAATASYAPLYTPLTSISGTSGTVALFGASNTLGNSKISQVSNDVIVDGGLFINVPYFLGRDGVGNNRFVLGWDSGISGGSATDINMYTYGNNNYFISTNGSKRIQVTGGGSIITNNATDTNEHFIIGGSARVNGTTQITGNTAIGSGFVSYTGFTVLTLANATNGGLLAVRNASDFGLNIFATNNGGHISAIDGTKSLIFETADTNRLQIFNDGQIITANATDTNEHFIIGGSARVNGTLDINGGVRIKDTSSSNLLELANTINSNYLFLNSGVGLEAMIRYYNPTAGDWYTGIRASAGIGSTSSYHIYSSTFGYDVLALNTNGSATFASSVTATNGIFTGVGDILTLSKTSNNIPTIAFIGATANTYIYGGDDFIVATNLTDRLTITKAGAATFSSSVTSNSYIYSAGRTTSFGFRLPDWQIYNTSGGALAFNNYATDFLSIASSGAATFANSVTVNNNTTGLILNRTAVTNYNGVGYTTNGVGQWFVGLRENLLSNNYVIYSEDLTLDVLTLSTSTGAATFSSGVTATSFTGSLQGTATTASYAPSYLPLAGGTMAGTLQVGGQVLAFDQSGTRSWNVQASGGELNFISGDGLGTFDFDYIVNAGTAVQTPTYYTTTASSRSKLRLWGNNTNYAIGMESSVTFGGLNDYAMTFLFNNETDRGFWWGHSDQSTAQGAMALTTDGNLTVAARIRVGYGTSDTTTPSTYAIQASGDVDITGTLTAAVKSFVIDHPTKSEKKLQYGVLEGPEHSVYVRGKLKNTKYITLPDYWHALVHEDSITVNLTAIGKKQDIWVEEVNEKEIIVGYEGDTIEYFYTVFAERKDVDKLITEYDKEV